MPLCTPIETAETRHGRKVWRCQSCGNICLGDKALPMDCGPFEQPGKQSPIQSFESMPCSHRGQAFEELVQVRGGCCGAPMVDVGVTAAECFAFADQCEANGIGGLRSCFTCQRRTNEQS